MSVRSDLEEATGLSIKKGEQLAAFKLRLIEAMSDEDMDEKYKAMPAASRKWYNAAVKKYQASEELDALPEFPEEEAEEAEEQEETADQEEETEATAEEAEDDEEADEEDSDADTGDEEVTHTDVSETTGRKGYRSKTSSKAKAKAAAPAPKAKSNKKAAPAKGKKDGGAGKGLDYARKLLAKDITMSATDLRDKVQAAGYEVSDNTLSTGASGFRAAVRALQNAGKLKSKMLDE